MRRMPIEIILLTALLAAEIATALYVARKYGDTGVTQDGQPDVLMPRQTCDLTPAEMLDGSAFDEMDFAERWAELDKIVPLYHADALAVYRLEVEHDMEFGPELAHIQDLRAIYHDIARRLEVM